MERTKLWVTLLICVVGSAVLLSCNPSTTGVLRVTSEESGYYPVDVAQWWSESYSEEGETYLVWNYTFTDATMKATAYYANGGSGMPEVPGRAIRLYRYKITWTPDIGLPAIDNGLDVVVDADPEGKRGSEFTILVMPGAAKDTIGALAGLRAEPEFEEYWRGSLGAKGTLKVYGKDLLTGQEYEADGTINAQFADYKDPNNYH